MSILSNAYNIQDANISDFDTNFPISASKFARFVFDVDKLTKTSNEDVTVLINFGDPFSNNYNPNEILKNTVLDCLVDHTFTYSGYYNITLISNIDNILHHINKTLTIYPIGNYFYTNPISGSFFGYNEISNVEIKCFDSKAKIFYKIIDKMTSFEPYEGSVSFIMDVDYVTIEFYAILRDGNITPTESSTFTQVKVWAIPPTTASPNPLEVLLHSNVPESDVIIYYTLDGSDVIIPNSESSIIGTEILEVLIEDNISLQVE